MKKLALLAFLTAAVFAQLPTAELAGHVADQTQASIPGARITLRNTATGVARTAETNGEGYYILPGVQPGPYSVTAEKDGFPAITEQGLLLQVGQRARLDFELKVGQITSSVTVNESATEVRTSSSELGSVMQEQQVVSLPLNGRNFTQLLQLTPGASPISTDQNKSGGTGPAIGTFTFPAMNGQLNRSNLFYTDGVNNTSHFQSAYNVPPILDTIEEFKVESHNDSAEAGMTTGGIINVVSKSGTNEYHGSAWEFIRNTLFDARNTFRTGITALHQDMFGGTLGGPIRKNHTFIMVGYQGFINNTPASTLYRVPTAANLQGNLSDWPQQIYDPTSTRVDPVNPGSFIRDPFPGNVIPQARIDPGMLAFANATLPAPNYHGAGGNNEIDLTPSSINQQEYTGRLDQTFSEHDSVWTRWSGLKYTSQASAGRQGLLTNSNFDAMNIGASWMHIFSPASLLQFTFGHSFTEQLNPNTLIAGHSQTLVSAMDLDPTFCCAFHDGTQYLMPNVNVPQFFSGGESYNKARPSNLWQYKLAYSLVRGRHELKFGAEFYEIGYDSITNSTEVDFDPSNTGNPQKVGTTGSALASFLLGVPIGAQKSDFVRRTGFGGVISAYAQDSWRVTTRLTVNVGLRLDFTMIPDVGNGNGGPQYYGNMDMINGIYWISAVPGSCGSLGKAPCIPTADGSLPAHVEVGTLRHNFGQNLGPRAGIAYKLSDNTAIRSGFGIFYDNMSAVVQSAQNIGMTWPDVGRRQSTNFNAPTMQQLTPTITAENPFPASSLPSATPFTTGAYFNDPWLKNLYSMEWNFGIERALGGGSVLSVNYVGSGTRRMPIGGYYNVAVTPGPGSPSLRFPYPYITPTNFDRSWGRGNYNALQLQFRRRFSHGVTLVANYTWSKSIDIACDGFFGVEGCSVQNPYLFNQQRSVSGTDLPQNFNMAWTWDIPVSASNRLVNTAVHGWQLNGLATFFNGPPFTVNVSGDIANTGNATGYMRPNVVGDPNLSNPTAAKWFNTSAFAAPASYTFGNAGRNILRSEGAKNFDISVFRSFPLRFREGMHLEFRGEAFNAFNTPRYAAPVSNLSASNFGQVTSTANTERQFQFAMKVIF